MKPRDDRYPLQADIQLNVSLDPDGDLVLEPWQLDVWDQNLSWLLEVDYQARYTLSEPSIETWQDGTRLFTQYLERGQQGCRWLNLTGISQLDDIKLVARHCRLGTKIQLHGFVNPPLEDGPLLIIAPHPDDAELAAYGLYQRLAEQTWIVTLSAGEKLKELDKQYLKELDGDIDLASHRKGRIRTWNSATTPMLAGIPPERLIMLGYFNDTLDQLIAAPDIDIPQASGQSLQAGQNMVSALRPDRFRCWNHLALPSDTASTNRGDRLISDLAHVLKIIRPATIVVTHPEVDPHKDHVAAAYACAQAMHHVNHIPDQVLLYANHLRNARHFPYGPPHSSATLWPLAQSSSKLGPWRFYSEVLSREVQRQKAVAMDTMHDLRAQSRLEKRFKQWLYQRVSGVRYARYGEHEYFKTHIKAHEVFTVVSGQAFLGLL